MGLTRRQADAIQQMIIAESRAAYASQQERHRILDEVDGEHEPVLEAKQPLPSALRHAIVDLIEAFYSNNRIYEGCEFDRGLAAKRAAEYLYNLIEADVKETADMLQSGDFEAGMDEESMPMPSMDQESMPMPSMDQDDDVELPPMHPRGSGKPGGISGGTGSVSVGKPAAPTGMRANLGEPKRGYPGGGGDEELPPMHPRGRR
jgi:hypothetical protein